jgi:hypothetical protein
MRNLLSTPYFTSVASRLAGLATILLLASSLRLSAQLLVYENFNYPTGTIAQKNGGIGFGAAWVEDPNGGVATVTSGNLSYSGVTSQGGRLLIYDVDNNSSHRISRQFATSYGADNTTVWISFLADKSSPYRDTFFGFSGLNFRCGGSGNWQVKTPSVTTYTNTPATYDPVHFFLVRIDFAAAQDRVYVWADPDLALGEPAVASAHVSLTDPNFSISSVAISHGPFGNSAQSVLYDEIRVARSFTSAVSGTTAAPNQPPVVSITGPASGVSFVEGASVSITASASDADGTVSKVEFYQGTQKLGEDLTAPYEYVISSIPRGQYAVYAKAIDNTGASAETDLRFFTVTGTSSAAPTVAFTAPASGTEYTAGASVSMAATASANAVKVVFYNGNIRLGEDTAAPFEFTWNNVPFGFFNLVAKAYTDDGQEGVSTLNIGVFPTQFNRKFYFSSSGNDTLNTGLSVTSPYKTIAKARSLVLQPGDMLLFKRGETFTGQLSIAYNGNAQFPIYIAAYGAGERPLLSGTTHCIYITEAKANYIYIDGLELANASRVAVEVRGGNIKVQNCYIRDSYNGGWAGAGIRAVNQYANLLVKNNTFKNLYGDAVYSQDRYRDIYIHDNYIGTVFDGTADNIQLRNVVGFEVLRNYMTMQGTNTGKGNFICEFSSNGLIADNICEYGNFGINVGGDNIMVERNIVRYQNSQSWSSGLYVQERAAHSNCTFRYNLVYNCTNGLYIFEPYNRTNFKIYNNTIYDCFGYGVRSSSPISGEMKNNIIWVSDAVPVSVNSFIPNTTWVSDYNNIGPNYTPSSGRDQNSLFTDPQLVYPPYDFHPLSTSPVINRGTDLGILLDVEHATVTPPPSIGAYETGLAGGALSNYPPITPGNLAVNTISTTQLNLVWEDRSNNEYGFFVEREINGIFVRIDTLKANVTSLSQPGLMPNTAYTYRVQAFNQNGASGYTPAENRITPMDLDQKINIVAVDASANDGNIPEGTLDSDLTTNWAAQGKGQWIRFDLGTAQPIDQIYIAFTRGDIRFDYFDIGASNSPDAYGIVQSGLRSSGDTLVYQKFDITNANARYLWIIGQGNSASTWNSYSEVQVQKPVGSVSLPSVPANFNATLISARQVNLMWSDASGEDGYVVYRRQIGMGVDTIAVLPPGATSYNDVSAIPYTTLYYVVGAYNVNGASYSDGKAVVTPLPPPTSYHVANAPEGNDNNPGTLTAPFATVAKVMSTLLYPGDTVKFKAGGEWLETLTVQQSGTRAKNITYTSYGVGEKPMLSGAIRVTGWIEHAPNVYKATIPGVTYMVVSYPSGSIAGQKLTRVGAIPIVNNQFHYTANTLYVFDASGNPDAAGKKILAAQRNNCIIDNGKSFITIKGLKTHVSNSPNILVDRGGKNWKILNNDIRYGESSKEGGGAGIHANQCNALFVQGNDVRDAHGDGILVQRSDSVKILNNNFYTVWLGVNNGGGDCIQMSTYQGIGCNHFEVKDNFMTQQGTNTPKGCFQQEYGDFGVISGNRVEHGRFGIEINGNNILVENNICAFQTIEQSANFGAGIYMSEYLDYRDNTFRNNLVYGFGSNGINIDGTNGGNGPGNYYRRNFKFYNNTIVGNGDGFRSSQFISGEFKNNIIKVNPKDAVYGVPKVVQGETWLSDNNILYNPNPSNFVISGGSNISIQYRIGSPVTLNGASSGVQSDPGTRSVLLKINFDPAGNSAFMWVDPNLASGSPEPAESTAQAQRVYTTNFEVGSVILAHINGPNNDSYFSGIKVSEGFSGMLTGNTPDKAYEYFSYPAGSSLEGANGGLGWSVPWDVLSATATVGTNSVGVKGTAVRALFAPVKKTSGSVWISFRLTCSSSARAAQFNISEGIGGKFTSLSQYQIATGRDLFSKEVAPQFVDEANRNYKLANGSEGIDLGADVGVTKDIEGGTRPKGNTFDAGAYESTFSKTDPRPTVSLTSPLNGSNFAVGSTVTIQASAAAAGGTIARVEFYVGYVKVGQDLTAPYEYVWNATFSGSFKLYAVAISGTGSSVVSNAINITVGASGGPGARIASNTAATDEKESSAEESVEAGGFTLYPNPTNGDITLTFDAEDGLPMVVYVSDQTGKVVLEQNIQAKKGNHQVSLATAELPQGFYFVVITTGEKKELKKFIVLR